MGGANSINRLPEEKYEQLICFNCKAYLSCSPLKSLPDGNFVCGRCNFKGCLHQSLSEEIFKDIEFPCRYKKTGCGEYILFDHVKHHETKCTYRTFACPAYVNVRCLKNISLLEAKEHIQNIHSDLIIKNNEFNLQTNKDISKRNLALFTNFDIIIVQLEYNCVDKILQIGLSRLTNAPNKALNYNLQFTNSTNNDCYATLANKTCGIYRTPLKNESCVEKVNMEPYLKILCNPSCITVKISISDTMGSSSSAYKLPEEKYEQLLCWKCKAYLSCSPLKTLPDGKFLCGRCNSLDFVHQTLSEQIFKDVEFPCQYKKNGCKEYFLFNNVISHENNCTHRTFVCPAYIGLSCVTNDTNKVLSYNLQFTSSINNEWFATLPKKQCGLYLTPLKDEPFVEEINMAPYISILSNPSSINVKILFNS
ncbi:hypothetical protein FQR65_LT02059 [Abscondita terminalis]|nr:hypothetical protein FQR65_LT02059 [Abscondita terminalis]